ncbi:hypothetical protein C8F04DRAFT_1327384 [Mycena alexandri]|uniref:Uncharacterized protein n=1 Tax=Mycena alexandri TaxID=1745969 RepID=A0AAD6S085_9AGAR|nr:hypothetical protein C8F04DRAFT_1327384 [Mycena alexandri]
MASIFKRPNSPTLTQMLFDWPSDAGSLLKDSTRNIGPVPRRSICHVCGHRTVGLSKEDFDLHYSVHCMQGDAWCCKGVLKEQAAHYGLLDAPTYNFLGRERVGGCRKVFFQRLRLERHLLDPFSTCHNAVSLFMVSKHFYAISTCRHFWVYANIDADLARCRPGHGHFDFSTMSLEDLRTRVIRAARIFDAWRSDSVVPKRVHTLPLLMGTRQLLVIPWTRLIVAVDGDAVYLRDWATGLCRPVPVCLGPHLFLLTVKTFWIDSIARNVIVVAMARRQDGDLQLFVVDLDNTNDFSATHLATVKFEYPVTTFALQDQHLAVVGYTGSRSYYLQSLKISYLSPVTVSNRAMVYIETQGALAACSFAILDDTHFLLAGPIGVAVYKLFPRILASTSADPKRIKHCWEHRYAAWELVTRPNLGPVTFHPRTGHRSIAVCSGSFLRRVFMSNADRARFRLSSRPLINPVPVHLGVASGPQIGLYRRPYTSPTFTTFRMGGLIDSHPLSEGKTAQVGDRGGVIYRVALDEVLEPGSLHIDEGEGRILFMLGSRARHFLKAVVLEIA